MSETGTPAAVAGLTGMGDDQVLPFRAEASRVNGRLVRLGPLVDGVLSRHDYPEPVSVALGEALALSALLGAALKSVPRFTLQTQTDGPLNFMVVQYDAPGVLRGYAGFDPARIAEIGEGMAGDQRALLGLGHLAMTVDPAMGKDRYQGIVPIDGDTLSDAALAYFRQSEQLPTFLRLAVARHFAADPSGEGGPGTWRWRAGGLMIQHLTPLGGHAPQAEAGAPDEEPRLVGEDDENWERTRILAATVEDHELIDPDLSGGELLYRLFHEEGVRVYRAVGLEDRCKCSAGRIRDILERFSAEQMADMVEDDGRIRVTCEFCNTDYFFAPEEWGNAQE